MSESERATCAMRLALLAAVVGFAIPAVWVLLAYGLWPGLGVLLGCACLALTVCAPMLLVAAIDSRRGGP